MRIFQEMKTPVKEAKGLTLTGVTSYATLKATQDILLSSRCFTKNYNFQVSWI